MITIYRSAKFIKERNDNDIIPGNEILNQGARRILGGLQANSTMQSLDLNGLLLLLLLLLKNIVESVFKQVTVLTKMFWMNWNFICSGTKQGMAIKVPCFLLLGRNLKEVRQGGKTCVGLLLC